MCTIANATWDKANRRFAADVIVDGLFAYRLISWLEGGINTLRLRDYQTREIIAETTSEKGQMFSFDARHEWVVGVVREIKKHETQGKQHRNDGTRNG